MMTFLIIVWIGLIIWLIRREQNQLLVIGKTREQVVDHEKKDLTTALIILLIFGSVLGVGIYLYSTSPLHKEVTKHLWLLGDVTRKAWTSEHYWALICSVVGGIGAMIGVVGTIRNAISYSKFNNMSESDYEVLQNRMELEYQQDQKDYEKMQKKQMRRHLFSIIGNLLNM